MKDTTFKMTGFPQHAGVSPVKQVLKPTPHFLEKKNKGPVEKTTYVTPDKKQIGPENGKKKTKTQKFLDKHPKIDKGVKKVKKVATTAWEKANKFAKTDAGKAVIAGLTRKATAPRPKKKVTAIISGEQKSIM